jgi:hypothetical protein
MVLFNDSSAGIVLTATSTQLTVVVPGYVTQGRIVVKSKGMESQTDQLFQIAPKFSPQSEAPGYPISIVTRGGPNLSDYIVSFNGIVASPTRLVNDLLTVSIPNSATDGKIIVTYKGKPYYSLTNFAVAPVGTVSNLTSQGVFSTPIGLAIDQNGNLVVAYAGNGSYNFNGGSPLMSMCKIPIR